MRGHRSPGGVAGLGAGGFDRRSSRSRSRRIRRSRGRAGGVAGHEAEQEDSQVAGRSRRSRRLRGRTVQERTHVFHIAVISRRSITASFLI